MVKIIAWALLFLAACSSQDSQKATDKRAVADAVTPDANRLHLEYTFETPGDTTKNFYITIFPEGEIRGSLILLSGFGELPTETLLATDIYKWAAQAGYITFIPALGDRLFFYVDSASNEKLHQFIDRVFHKYNLPDSNFFIGGYSLGGTAAFQYAEKAYATGTGLRKPSGVFGADPPLDLERLYSSMISTDRPERHAGAAEGEKFFTALLQEVFKTNPRENPEYFWKVSPFSFSDTTHAAIAPLQNVPLRIYNDPDINWYIEHRHVDYSDLNVVHAAAMVNWLRAMGNQRAALINALGKGYKNNERFPHAWSVIEGKELVAWMDTISK